MKIAPLLSILCITALVAAAIAQDINGAVLSSGIAVIAGLGGYTLGRVVKTK